MRIKPNEYVKYIRQVLLDIAEDFTETFKPYPRGQYETKAPYYTKREWKQPINGVKNCLRGLLEMAKTPFHFIVEFFWPIFNKLNNGYETNRKMALEMSRAVVNTVARPLYGLTLLVRGVTQTVTPLILSYKLSSMHFHPSKEG